MSGDTFFARTTTILKGAFAELFVGSPMLVYVAAFEDANMHPYYDPLGLLDLHEGTSQNVNFPTDGKTMLPVSARFPKGAVRLKLERKNVQADEQIALGVVLHTFPTDLKTFRIMATCSTPLGPHGLTDVWATAVYARYPGTYESVPRDQKIIVTLQAAWNDPGISALARPGARMNTPLPPPPGRGLGPWVSQEVFNTLFPAVTPPWVTNPDLEPDVQAFVPEPVFTLQLDVDRIFGDGQATLFVKAIGAGFIVDPGPGYTVGYTEGRTFKHPYMAQADANGNANAIGAAGVHLAITEDGGDGPVSVTLEDLVILGVPGGGGFLGLVDWPKGLKQLLQPARNRLLEWAYAGVSSRQDQVNRQRPGLDSKTKRGRR